MVELDAAVGRAPARLAQALAPHASHAHAVVEAHDAVAGVQVGVGEAGEGDDELLELGRGPAHRAVAGHLGRVPVVALAMAVGRLGGVDAVRAAVDVARPRERAVGVVRGYIEAGGEAVDVADVQEERVAGETTLEQRNRATFARRGEGGGAVAGAVGGNGVGEAFRRKDHIAVRLDEGLLQELELAGTVIFQNILVLGQANSGLKGEHE